MVSLGLTLDYVLEFKRDLWNIIFKKKKRTQRKLGQASMDAIGVNLAG